MKIIINSYVDQRYDIPNVGRIETADSIIVEI